jgi:hypothetical protein
VAAGANGGGGVSSFFIGMAMSGIACGAAMVGADCLRRGAYLIAAANLTMALATTIAVGVVAGIEIATR